MTYNTYKKIFDKIKPYAIAIQLHNWGEPLLNKDLFKIINLTKKYNIKITLSSNFNLANKEIITNLLDSKIDKLIISLDGTNEESYTSYRIGGDFEKVLNNTKDLLSQKSERKLSKPEVTWQYLIHNKNKKYILDAKKLAKRIGIKINFPKFQLSQEVSIKNPEDSLINEWILPENQKNKKEYLFTGGLSPVCKRLYYEMTINSTGSVSPCCAVYDEKEDFGNLLFDSLETLWNNKKYISSRDIFNNKKETNTICYKCVSFWKNEE